MNAQHSGEEIKMCWSKLRDQTKKWSQQINNDKKHRSSQKPPPRGGRKKKTKKYTDKGQEEDRQR